MEDLLIMVLWTGVQSLNNKRFYNTTLDPKTGKFVGKWVDRPSFLDRLNEVANEQPER